MGARSRTELLRNPLQVTPVSGLEIFCRQGAQLLSCDESPHKGHLFGTSDNQPLPMLNRTNEFRGFEQRSSRIEPSITAAELHDVKLPALQVAAVDVGDNTCLGQIHPLIV